MVLADSLFPPKVEVPAVNHGLELADSEVAWVAAADPLEGAFA
jgi:hypothetical protein